jgi:hypothetical protein
MILVGIFAASDTIIVPGSQGDGFLFLAYQLENPETILEDSQALHAIDDPTIEDDEKLKDEEKLVEPTNGYNEVDDKQESTSS